MLEGELNAYDVLCNEWIVFTPATLARPARHLTVADRPLRPPKADQTQPRCRRQFAGS